MEIQFCLVGKLTDAVTINQMYVKDQLAKEVKAKDIVTIKTHLTGLEGAKVYLTTDRKQIDELTKFYRNDPYQVDIEGVCYLENNQVVFSVTDGAHKVVQVCLENQNQLIRSNEKNQRATGKNG